MNKSDAWGRSDPVSRSSEWFCTPTANVRSVARDPVLADFALEEVERVVELLSDDFNSTLSCSEQLLDDDRLEPSAPQLEQRIFSIPEHHHEASVDRGIRNLHDHTPLVGREPVVNLPLFLFRVGRAHREHSDLQTARGNFSSRHTPSGSSLYRTAKRTPQPT